MKADNPQTHLPRSDQDLSPPPNLRATNVPTLTYSVSPSPRIFSLRCGSTFPSSPPIVSSVSSPTLAARRLISNPAQIKPAGLRYDHPIYGQPPTPPMEIVSPTAIAARDYYLNLNYQHQLDTPPPSGSEIGTPRTRIHPALRMVTQASNAPRRHSAALEPYPMGLGKIGDFKLQALMMSRRGSATSSPPTFGNTGNRERCMRSVFKDDLDLESPFLTLQSPCIESIDLDVPPETERRIHNPLDPRYLGNIPFSYTTNKLREWGDVYLFNSATADAFIRAIAIPSIRTSSSSNGLHRALSGFSLPSKSVKIEADMEPIITKQLIKVRVVPHCKTKKPFYMQKYFPVRKSSSSRVSKHVSSPRYHPRHCHERYQGTKVEVLRDAIAAETEMRPAVPIHIEYALYRTPLLAAVLLCEHVKRGATVEIPLPFPEAWEDVIKWMYTGDAGANVSAKVRETVEYLGGTI